MSASETRRTAVKGAARPDRDSSPSELATAVRRALFCVGGAVLVFAADLLAKALAFGRIAPGEIVTVVPGLLNLRLSENRGALFGMGQGWGGLFVVFTIVAVVGILWAQWKYGRASRLLTVSMAVLLGGALGNLYDRVRLGVVRDFIDLHAGPYHWPTFNVADMGITVGCALIILYSFLAPKETPAQRRTGNR